MLEREHCLSSVCGENMKDELWTVSTQLKQKEKTLSEPH